MSSILSSILVGIGLCLVQLLAAIPWVAALDAGSSRPLLRRPATWGIALAGVIGAGTALALFISIVQDPGRLLFWGRPFGALLQLQLSLALFAVVFGILRFVWPKGGAVALAAFRESVRQPMFWLLVIFGTVLMILMPFIPYFTFGEDYKMVKELGYDTIMLLAVVFAVLTASMSISEEIEGRTAVTLMSKPVSRRQFLLGKFLGILLGALLMTMILGLMFQVVLWFKPWFDNEPLPNPAWLEPARQAWAGLGETGVNFALGAAQWFDVARTALPGLVLGFCQVMVLLAIAVALATRLPMVVNLVICLLVFFLGHLTPVLVQVSQRGYALVNFIAQFFNTVLPGLEYFDLGTVIARDLPPDPQRFAAYVGSVVFYAILYSTIALLFGLILFEDRDLA
jgi:hypothetical protein